MPTLLGDKIRRLRQALPYSLDRLAEETEISKSYLWELENRNTANPTLEIVTKLAAKLGVTREFLLNDDQVDPTAEVADRAFFRKYKNLKPETKQQIQNILKVLQETDKKVG